MGRGPFTCPLTGPFHTARFSRPRFFFFFSLAVGANACRGELVGRLRFVLHSSHVELRNGLPELIVLFRRETAVLQYAPGTEG